MSTKPASWNHKGNVQYFYDVLLKVSRVITNFYTKIICHFSYMKRRILNIINKKHYFNIFHKLIIRYGKKDYMENKVIYI